VYSKRGRTQQKKKEVIYCVARYILVDYEERRKKTKTQEKNRKGGTRVESRADDIFFLSFLLVLLSQSVES
jgi:hypothetical protein